MSSHPLLSLDLSYASFESAQLTVEELGVPASTNDIEDLLRKVNLVLEDDDEHAIEALLKQVNDVINDGEDEDSINTTQTTISKVGYSAPTMSFVHNQHTNEFSSVISRATEKNSYYDSPLYQTRNEEERITKYDDYKSISRNTSPDIEICRKQSHTTLYPPIMKTFNLPKIEYNSLISEVDQTMEVIFISHVRQQLTRYSRSILGKRKKIMY